MLSFKKGKEIAIVYKKEKGKRKPIPFKKIKITNDDFYNENNEEENEDNKHFKVKDIKNHFIMPLPRKESERIYISAPSGSGKSTFIGLYLKEIRKMYKDRPIYLFSRIEDDEPLDAYDPIRIPLSREYFDEEPLNPVEFSKGVIIFDDIDTLMDKQLLKYIQGFRDDLLECGRHYDITTISTTHIISNYKSTRTLLNEANAMILFPKCSGQYQFNKFLERYMGYDKDQIERVKKLPSRWIYLYKNYPQYIVYEKGVIIV